MASYDYGDQDLKTLQRPDGAVPRTRMESADMMRDIINRAILHDVQTRDWKRSKLAGLVNGNPPYSKKALIDAGRGDECNVNWRIAKYFLGLAKGMLYDVFSEAENYTTVTLDPYKIRAHPSPGFDKNFSFSQADDWSHIVTEEFQTLQTEDPNFDFANQQSQGQSVFYGCGPMHFADELDWRPISHESKMLIVPEIAKSNTNYWDWAGLAMEYSPDQLYARIVNASAASQRGWNVRETRRSIMNAHPLTRTGITYQSWSWHEDMLKNNSFGYVDQSKRIRVVHFYFREFPEEGEDEGRITEGIIDLDPQGDNGSQKYLFWAPRKYANWREIIHPMYWDHDLNGYHYSVNGLGLEMYAALEYLNRLYCRQADDAFAPKLFFKPTTASERERMSIAQVGRYAILPAALEMMQQHVQPLLADGLAMSHEIQGLVSSNLSQYRSSALSKQQGNPVTARQIDYEASEQAKMGKTQLSRIYEQYDWLYAEKYRRATNPDLSSAVRGGAAALAFWKRCEQRGVPKWALTMTKSVKATRVIGQGSQFLRQQALEFLLGLVGMIPSEIGRTNLINDVIASRAGQDKVRRYNPQPERLSSDEAAQRSEAMLQVAAMKTGVPPVPVPTQNPMIFATIFLGAAEGSVAAAQQGADPHETVSFLTLAIPAINAHLQRMSMDQTRQGALKPMVERLHVLEKVLGDLEQALAQQQAEAQQRQQQMAAMQAGQDPDTQIGLAKVAAKERVDMAKVASNAQSKAVKQQVDTALKATGQQADMALAAQRAGVENQIKVATAASDIALAHRKAAAAPKKED